MEVILYWSLGSITKIRQYHLRITTIMTTFIYRDKNLPVHKQIMLFFSLDLVLDALGDDLPGVRHQVHALAQVFESCEWPVFSRFKYFPHVLLAKPR